MKLREYLQNMDPEEKICIGTENGGGWLYFGVPSVSSVENCFGRYHSRQASTKWYYENERHDTGGYFKSLCAWLDDDAESFLELDRDVVETYCKSYDECTAIIIEGYELGKYWTEEEYLCGDFNKSYHQIIFDMHFNAVANAIHTAVGEQVAKGISEGIIKNGRTDALNKLIDTLTDIKNDIKKEN